MIASCCSKKRCMEKNVRLSRADFDEICNELRPYVSPNILRVLPVEKKVAVVLYFLKDTTSMTTAANLFRIYQGILTNNGKAVCSVIVTYMVPKLTKFPNSQDKMLSKISEFEVKFGMTEAFRCIDGTHIPLKAPTVNSQDYYNYEQFYSLNVQGVCDYKGYFVDFDCRWPSSCHDGKFYANSSINRKMQHKESSIIYREIILGEGKIANYLTGDPVYPLTSFSFCKSNQKQPSRGVLKKRCSENMRQIYRRTPMPKCDFALFAILKKICLAKYILELPQKESMSGIGYQNKFDKIYQIVIRKFRRLVGL